MLININVKDEKVEKFINLLEVLKDDYIDSYIEVLDPNDEDFKEIEKIKRENNKKYTLTEVESFLNECEDWWESFKRFNENWKKVQESNFINEIIKKFS